QYRLITSQTKPVTPDDPESLRQTCAHYKFKIFFEYLPLAIIQLIFIMLIKSIHGIEMTAIYNTFIGKKPPFCLLPTIYMVRSYIVSMLPVQHQYLINIPKL